MRLPRRAGVPLPSYCRAGRKSFAAFPGPRTALDRPQRRGTLARPCGLRRHGSSEGLFMDVSREGTSDCGGWWRREGVVWGLLLALAVGEYALVRRYVAVEVAPAYPAGWDQAVYLRRSYAVYEQLRREGSAAALRTAL